MPLIPFARPAIELPVADRTVNDTIIRQKARFLRLLHEQGADDVSTVLVTVRVTMYAAAGAGAGPELVGPGFTPYEVGLVADNNTVVDAETGEILLIRSTESGLEWYTASNSIARPVMLQGDFFALLRDNQPMRIGDMIRQHIQQADAAGKFN